MTDTQSGSQDPASPNEPRSVDTEALFLKSLSAVFKEYRNVLPCLPELMEQCVNTEPLNPDLAESRPKEESRGGDAERSAERKRSDLEFGIDVKPERTLVERELKKKDKLLQESERKAQCLEEECSKLKKELEKREKEISETRKVQEEKIYAVKNESENKVKEMSDKVQQLENELQKEKGDLQTIYGEYQKALKEHKSSHDSMIDELAVKDKEIQEYLQRIYAVKNESENKVKEMSDKVQQLENDLSKIEEELINANTKVDLYKSRLASVSEKRVKQDQRLVEDTLSLNRQSDLERDFSTFFDAERMDACDKMQSIYQANEDSFVYIYYPRLACIIFETAYEQVKEAKEAATDLFKELLKIIINAAPGMAKCYSKARKEQKSLWKVSFTVSTWTDGTECPKDVVEGMILSLKEAARTCNLDYFVESVSKIAFWKWEKWSTEDKSCIFRPASHLMKELDKYIKDCIRLTWRMVTQVPPMKLEFHSLRFSNDIHKKKEYYTSEKRPTRSSKLAHQDQGDEIAYYLWPGLQDGGGRLIRAGEVLCRFNEL